MKKTISKILLVTVCAVLCLSLAACGGSKGTSVEGTTWKMTSITTSDGTEMSGDDLESVFGETLYAFEADGVLAIASAGQEIEGTWSQDGDTVTIEASGAATSATVSGSTMTLENEAGSCEFTQQ